MSSLSGIKCWGEPLPPQEFLRKFALPQVVRVLEGNKVHGPSKMDLDRPLLLHKAYICQQVHARSIDRDKNGGITYVGPPLILPDTYPGWFAVITDEGHTAGYFGSVSEVAGAQVPYFLSREQAQAYREDTDPKGNLKYSKAKIKPGEVLQFLGAYEDTTYTSKHSRPLRYAKVVDRQGDLLFLPFPTPGKFFSVAGRRTRSVSHVFRLTQLLSVANLPITVRLVSGPKGPKCPFTGLLRLEWSEERHVILSCALRGLAGGEPTLLEIDVSSEFRFLRPMDDQKVRLSKAFARMLRHCGEKGEAWRQQIKIAHHVIPNSAKRTTSHGSQGGATSSGDSYEDEDSGVRSSTVKSLSSSKSSASSRLFKRLRLLHQSWKNGHRATTSSSRGEASGSEDSGLPKDALSRQYSDFHLYERVRGPLRRNSWGNSSNSTEILDDDGYVTSDFGGEESSTYDSVC